MYFQPEALESLVTSMPNLNNVQEYKQAKNNKKRCMKIKSRVL